MTKTVFILTFGGFVGLAGIANASPATVVDVYNQCMDTETGTELTAECKGLRASINAAIQDCMYPPGGQTAGGQNSHGFKARSLICTASARQQFGATGH